MSIYVDQSNEDVRVMYRSETPTQSNPQTNMVNEKGSLLPAYTSRPDANHVLCSWKTAPGLRPYPDNNETWARYGVHGGAMDNLSKCHNRAYAVGFSMAQTIVRFFIAPMSIPAAWLWGFWIATFSVFAQVFALHAVAKLVGEFFGIFVLECTGKRLYYQKKAAYFELAALELKERNPKLQLSSIHVI
eukprot:m.36170 g.36170  ORF g.36170 m.36170 type:complete len:188 (-) comp17271_c0_seq1:232-795(-)